MNLSCPSCGEDDDLSGERVVEAIVVTCGACGHRWERSTKPSCPTCGTTELRTVPLAILEKSRGTQLSMVGTRPIDLCPTCDAETIAHWQKNRPNPLMPDEVPNLMP